MKSDFAAPGCRWRARFVEGNVLIPADSEKLQVDTAAPVLVLRRTRLLRLTSRRVNCAYLAELVADNRLDEAVEVARDLAYHLSKATCRL